MKTKTFVVNVGLNNNPCTEQGCIDILKGGYISPYATFTDFVTHVGEYEGKPEPTLIMKMTIHSFNAVGWQVVAQDVVQLMCTKFTQDCIAMRQEGANEGDGVLIWNEAIVDRPYTFDPAFFIDPYRKPDGYAIFCVAQWLGHIEDLDARWEEAKKCYDEFIRSEYNDMSRPELQGINEFMDNRTRLLAKLEKPSGKYKFPRKCDITGMGMWEGYCFGDGQDYAIDKSGASTIAAQYGYETLEEAWEDDAYYFTEWQELDEEDGWYESDYEDGRDAVWVDAE